MIGNRRGDTMLLTDFLVTRVVEVGIHGLNLADALDRPAWLTPAWLTPAGCTPTCSSATRTGRRLLPRLGRPDAAAQRDRPADLTGREAAGLERLDVRRLTLG